MGIPHGRCLFTFESSEESDEADIIYYLGKMKDQIGKLDLIFVVDSGCGDYDHIYNTLSLRGSINFELNVRCLKEGVHSGSNGGIAADTFNICGGFGMWRL